MENWEKHMKNINNKPLPENVKQRIDSTLQSLPPKKRFRRVTNTIFAITAIFGILLGASFVSPAFAEKLKSLPVIDTITTYLQDESMENSYDQGITVPVQKEYTIDGIDVLFTEIVYDGLNIHIGYLVSKAPLEEQRRIFENFIPFVNGERFSFSRSFSGERTEDMFYAGKLKLDPLTDELPDQFHLELKLSKDVTAAFDVEKKGNNDVYATAESKQRDGLLLHYNSVTFTPAQTTISLDEIGYFDDILEYIVKDDTGRVLKNISEGSVGYSKYMELEDGKKEMVLKRTITVEPMNKKPRYLKVIPYVRNNEEGRAPISMKRWTGTPLRLSQGELGSVLITDVKRHEDDVSVYLTANGIDEYRQGRILNLQDESGNFFDQTMEQIGNHAYKITFEDFPADSEFILVTSQLSDHTYLKDLEVTIPIERED